MTRQHSLFVLVLVAVVAPNLRAAEPTDFVKEVAPILQGRCVRCHSSEQPKGKFSIATKEDFLRGGESGPAIVAGKPEESLLLEMVIGTKPDMPAEGPPLTKQQIDCLRMWIAEGAPWPDGFELQERAAAGLDWWAFQPVKRSELPLVKRDEWPRNNIDRFVLAKLEERHLSPSPEADRRTFIRRLSYDLLGLPPTPEQVAAFLVDDDPLAAEKLVDAFLSSPHYGERWARHWLDTAHYADTHGFERDQRRDHAWPYRDYVIKSLNDDKPYGDFVREQIAGDVLRPNDAEAIIATGFLAAGPWDFVGQVETGSPTLKRAARADDLDDMLTQVLTATCAVTINCARCHDHKLDPITQREYYQLSAVFAGVKRSDRDLKVARDANPDRERLVAERQRLTSALRKLSPAQFDLADIVGGGDGCGTGSVGAGIDQVTGNPLLEKRALVADAKPNQFQSSPLKFVDGVVVPQPSKEGTQITSTGIKVSDVPQTSAQVWDAIRYGPVNSQFSTTLDGIDFAQGGHSLLSLHANAAITFDLDELRASGVARALRFTASVGYFGETPKGGASYFVYVDGKLVAQGEGIGRDDGLFAIDLAIGAKDRFLTLMATDNANGISHDQICFADPRISEVVASDIPETERLEKVKLEQALRDIDRSLLDFPAIEKVYAAVCETPPEMHLLHRGDPEQPGDIANPGALECLTGVSGTLVASATEGERRLALADWIVHPQHPLTQRVIANRLWHYHFGVGIVDTPSDFGFGGGRPTHPELLDYLACELEHHKGSLKHLHRLICTSATYRQQSFHERSPERDIDSNNRLLWRMNPRRLDAESLRDSVLAVTGKLNTQMYGPGFHDFDYTEAYAPIYEYIVADKPELWRRAVYRFTVRTTAQPFLTTLDCPSPANLTPTRNVTTTALQSLALLNNEFMLRQSGHLAERVEREAGNDPKAQVVRAFALAFARSPKESELVGGVRLIGAHGLQQFCRMLLNTNEFVHVD